MVDKVDVSRGVAGATEQNAGFDPRSRGRRGEMTEGMVGAAELVQSPFLPMVASTSVELGHYHGCQNRALKYPGVFTKPHVILSPAKPNVNSGIKQKRAGRKPNHAFFDEARPKTSRGLPSFRRFRRA